MKKEYKVEDYATGTVIDVFYTYKDALEAVAEMEDEDKADGNYEPGFYAIRRGDEKRAERIW